MAISPCVSSLRHPKGTRSVYKCFELSMRESLLSFATSDRVVYAMVPAGTRTKRFGQLACALPPGWHLLRGRSRLGVAHRQRVVIRSDRVAQALPVLGFWCVVAIKRLAAFGSSCAEDFTSNRTDCISQDFRFRLQLFLGQEGVGTRSGKWTPFAA